MTRWDGSTVSKSSAAKDTRLTKRKFLRAVYAALGITRVPSQKPVSKLTAEQLFGRAPFPFQGASKFHYPYTRPLPRLPIQVPSYPIPSIDFPHNDLPRLPIQVPQHPLPKVDFSNLTLPSDAFVKKGIIAAG